MITLKWKKLKSEQCYLLFVSSNWICTIISGKSNNVFKEIKMLYLKQKENKNKNVIFMKRDLHKWLRSFAASRDPRKIWKLEKPAWHSPDLCPL